MTDDPFRKVQVIRKNVPGSPGYWLILCPCCRFSLPRITFAQAIRSAQAHARVRRPDHGVRP